MVPDEVNRALAAGAQKPEIPFRGGQMERMNKSPQRAGNFRLNQALWYLSHGRNLLGVTDYNSKLGELATQNWLAQHWPTASQ